MRGHLPLSIWVDSHVELRIEPGDSIKVVATALQKYWPVTFRQACAIAAYWFALGERQARRITGPWERGELDPSPKRAYRPKSPRR